MSEGEKAMKSKSDVDAFKARFNGNDGAKPKPEPHPLVGRGLHYRTEDGYVQNQASILAVFPSAHQATGNLALIQYFDWIVGAPSTQRLIPLAELASGYGPEAGQERWMFFENIEEANDYYEHKARHRNEHIRAGRRINLDGSDAGPASVEPERTEPAE